MKGHVLVVHPDFVAASRLRNDLCSRQYITHTARRGDDALSLLGLHRIEALVTRLDLPDHEIQWFYTRVSARHPTLKDSLIFMLYDELSEAAQAFVADSGCETVPSGSGAAELDETLSRHMRR
jgi:DNA-binding response OmpR family regulator